jgi:hypothetical protein
MALSEESAEAFLEADCSTDNISNDTMYLLLPGQKSGKLSDHPAEFAPVCYVGDPDFSANDVLQLAEGRRGSSLVLRGYHHCAS